MGNADQLSALFRNLIDNAVRYAATTVRVTATVTGQTCRRRGHRRRPASRWRTGTGSSTDSLRLDGSRDRGSGTTGLGLAIAREIAAAHHGGISVADTHDGGARLVVWLPSAPDQPRSTRHTAESVP